MNRVLHALLIVAAGLAACVSPPSEDETEQDIVQGPSFTVSVAPTANPTVFAVTVSSHNMFSGQVNLAASVPNGTEAFVDSVSVSPLVAGHANLYLYVDSTPAGSYAVKVSGISGSIIASATFTFAVVAPSFTVEKDPILASEDATATTWRFRVFFGLQPTLNASVWAAPISLTFNAPAGVSVSVLEQPLDATHQMMAIVTISVAPGVYLDPQRILGTASSAGVVYTVALPSTRDLTRDGAFFEDGWTVNNATRWPNSFVGLVFGTGGGTASQTFTVPVGVTAPILYVYEASGYDVDCRLSVTVGGVEALFPADWGTVSTSLGGIVAAGETTTVTFTGTAGCYLEDLEIYSTP